MVCLAQGACLVKAKVRDLGISWLGICVGRDLVQPKGH